MIYFSEVKKLSNNSKYLIWYINLCQSRIEKRGQYSKKQKQYKLLQEKEGYFEIHHILPSSICDIVQKKDKNNYVILTAREHYIAHLLLTKLFDSDLKYKMKLAMGQFTRKSKNQGRVLNSRQFEVCRKLVAESIKHLHTGVSKPKSPEHRLKISKALAGRKGISRPNPNKGKPGLSHSIKTKELLSNINLGKKRSKESCKKQSMTMQGHKGYNNKKWKVTDIMNNIEYFPESILDFSKHHHLCAGNLYQAERDRSIHKKQWRVEKLPN